MNPEGLGLDPEGRRRVSLAVRAGVAVRDPADAPAAVELARLAQRRLEARTLPSALRISAGVVLVWLVLLLMQLALVVGLAGHDGLPVMILICPRPTWAAIPPTPAKAHPAARTTFRSTATTSSAPWTNSRN